MLIRQKESLNAACEILTLSILELFPQAKVLDTYLTGLGFAVDFSIGHPLDDQLFALLEERMRILFKKNLLIEPVEMMRKNAADLFFHRNQDFLAQHILEDPYNIVSLVRIENHYGYQSIDKEVNTRSLGTLKLLQYKNQNEKLNNKESIIISIEGVLFEDNQSLKKFVKCWNKEKNNNYQKLGPTLQLFFLPKDAPPGNYSWLPKGQQIKDSLISWWKETISREGYVFITTSKRSSKENKNFYLSDPKDAIKDFIHQLSWDGRKPLRLAEISEAIDPVEMGKRIGVYHESIYTKDSAYCVCGEEEVLAELISSLQFLLESFKMFDIDFQWYVVCEKQLSTEVKGSKGTGGQFKGTGIQFKGTGVQLLTKALDNMGLLYKKDLESPFRGSRIEVRLLDSLGREWRGSTIELASFLLKGNGVERDSDGRGGRAYLITRSLFGSVERFVALLVERFAGKFPAWLAPEQVRVIPDKELKWSKKRIESQ